MFRATVVGRGNPALVMREKLSWNSTLSFGDGDQLKRAVLLKLWQPVAVEMCSEHGLAVPYCVGPRFCPSRRTRMRSKAMMISWAQLV